MTGFLTQFDLGMLGQNEKCLKTIKGILLI